MFSSKISHAVSGYLSLPVDSVVPAKCRGCWFKRLAAAATLALCLGLTPTGYAQSERIGGAVFVGTNHNNTLDPSGPANQVVMYRRNAGGALKLLGYFDTGGQGSGPSRRFAGDGLGSAHSVQLSQDKKFLFVTNAGSDSVSVFRVAKNGLKLIDVEPTGDGSPGSRFPNSVTQDGDLVYVLNAADQGSISGLRLSARGVLTPIPGSLRSLDANQTYPPDVLSCPSQLSFTPDGRQLVVTIKDGPAAGALPGVTPTGPGRVLVFDVGRDGLPSETYTRTDLNNTGPFGFSFDAVGNLLAALFVGGPNLTGSAGSFRVGGDGTLTAITPNVPNFQLDTCWLENDGQYAYTSNYSSGTISSYVVGRDGSLKLLDAVAGIAAHPGNIQGATPIDIRISHNGKFLYDVLPGSGRVAGWLINSDGSLTKVGEFGGLPQTINGDTAPEERFGPGGSPAGIEAL